MQKIILASSSPRRIEILKDIDLSFENIDPAVDEEQIMKQNHEENTSPYELAVKLSYLKAESVAIKYPSFFVLGADTIVSLDQMVLGKPKTKKDAVTYLKLLSNRTHEVITGYSWICKDNGSIYSNHETTRVSVRKLTTEDIKRYIDSEDVLNVAGAYKIQSFYKEYIVKIDGFFHNVMGLPVSRVFRYYKMLLNI